jgi:endoglucanase
MVVSVSLAITLGTAAFLATPASAAPAAAPTQVRVNQVGYPASGLKVAYVMLARPVAAVRFEVTTRYGAVYRGTSTDDVGSWNSAYRAVYQLSFSGVNTPGVYQVKVTSPAAASSPAFVIALGGAGLG